MPSVIELEKNKVQVEFEISREELNAAEVEAYKKSRGKYQVPGFRKGHAPKNVLEQFYGKELFFEQAFDQVFPEAFGSVVEQEKLEPVDVPFNVDIVSMEDGQPLVVKCEVYVKPEVALGECKGLEAEAIKCALPGELYERELESIRERNSRYEDSQDPAAMGDRVIIDYSGSVNGEKFEGGTAEAMSLDLGSKRFIPGFEEQLVGMTVGEEKDIEVTFPEQYHVDELAGAPAIFAIKLIAIKKKVLPELDDEFAQDVSEFDTFEEFKADLLNKVTKQANNEQRAANEDAIIHKLVDLTPIDVPDCMIEQEIDAILREMSYYLAMQGVDYNAILGDEAQRGEYRKNTRDRAEKRVKSRLIVEAAREKLGVVATNEEIEAEIVREAEERKQDVADYKAKLTDRQRDYAKSKVEIEKLLGVLVESNTITYKETDTE